MTLDELNAKIEALPLYPNDRPGGCPGEFLDRVEARYLRDERLGMLCGDEDPTEEQVDIIARQLFPPPPQPDLI